MKKLTTLILASVLIGAACGGCEPKEKMTDVPFSEYSLDGTSCEWVNLYENNRYQEGKLIVINSDEELQNYITGEYTPVDFYQKTLLLAYGLELYQNAPNDTKLQLRSEHDYVMTVNLRPSVAATHLKWQVAIVVNKLSIEDKINLRITRL